MNFFFDNCTSPYFAAALNCLSHETKLFYEVTHLRDKFPPNAKDEVWLPALAGETEKAWVIVSADLDIHTSPHRRAIWRQSGLTTFFLMQWWDKLNRWNQASRMFLLWPDIVSTARTIEQGTGFEVLRNSSFRVMR